MWVFASSLELVTDIVQNQNVRHHANQMVKVLDKIIILLTQKPISEQEKQSLVELGKLHYHYGLKKEHFIVFLVLLKTSID